MSRQRQRQRVEGKGGGNGARQARNTNSGNSGGGNSGNSGGNSGNSGNGGNSGSGGGNNAGGGGGNRSRRSRNRRRRDRRRGEQRSSFWGDPTALPQEHADVEITDDASAVARSLGPPPLPGHEAVAAHYFRVVYDRAVMTAGALAAAGGLISTEELSGDDSD